MWILLRPTYQYFSIQRVKLARLLTLPKSLNLTFEVVGLVVLVGSYFVTERMA